ncbi:MAG TPA: hypothetical protein VGB49_02910, partial [Caulobacteraceae bacterium]
MSLDRPAALAAWLDATWAGRSLRTRADVERRQARLWRRFAKVVARTPALAHLAGRPLEVFPVTEPAAARSAFDQWNTLGLSRDRALAAAQAA